MTPQSVVSLDRQILAALMIDGRASWRGIAEVLDLPERTVTRRGSRLLEAGVVEIHAMADPHRTGRGDPYLVFGRTVPGRAWNVAAALARRAETVATDMLLGEIDFFCDIWCPEHRRATFFHHELPDIAGLESIVAVPVLRYIRTLHDWDPGLLTSDQVAGLRAVPAGVWPQFSKLVALTADERLLMTELARDGRQTFDQLGRLCGVSEQTTARKFAKMRASQLLTIRAVFDPAIIGLPVGAFLRLCVRPDLVEQVANDLARERYVRYAAVTMGNCQIVADLRLESKDALYRTLLEARWVTNVESMSSSLILDVLKQSEVLSSALR